MARKQHHFACTPGGAVATGRRRLALLLGSLGFLMVGVAIACWWTGRVGPAVLAILVASVPLIAWRWNGNAAVRGLTIAGDRLTIEAWTSTVRLPIAGAHARRLTDAERDHLTSLATTGGLVVGTGGFDSRFLGEVDLYASNLQNAVLIEAGEQTAIVTPDDPVTFLAQLDQSNPDASSRA